MGGEERIDAVWRDVHRGRVWRAQACRIVEESPEHDRALDPARARRRRFRSTDGLRIPATTGSSSTELQQAATRSASRGRGRAHSIYVFWKRRRQFEPLVRQLRAAAAPDAGRLRHVRREARPDRPMPDGTYRWKDEDELEQAAAAGLLDAGEVRAEARARARGVAVPDRLGGLAAGSGLAGPAAAATAGTACEAARAARGLRRVRPALGRLGGARAGGAGGRRRVEGRRSGWRSSSSPSARCPRCS